MHGFDGVVHPYVGRVDLCAHYLENCFLTPLTC
jgi:hypothetical protein